MIGKEGNKFKRFGRLGPKEYFNWTGVSNPLKQHRGHTRSPTYVFFQNGLSSVYFRLFKQTLGTIFTTKNLKMYIQYTCWDSNQGPWEHESTPITTRPWVPPNISTFVYIFEWGQLPSRLSNYQRCCSCLLLLKAKNVVSSVTRLGDLLDFG